MKEEIFISTMGIFVLFNTFYYMINGEAITNLATGGLMSIIVSGVLIAIIIGINALSVGLSDSTVKIVFVTIVLMNILFQVPITYEPLGINFNIGLGLASNVINAFSGSDDIWTTFGWILASGLTFMAFFSGILIVTEEG